MPSLPEIGSSLPEVVLRPPIEAGARGGIEDVRLAVLETDGSISVISGDGDTPASNRPLSDERTT